MADGFSSRERHDRDNEGWYRETVDRLVFAAYREQRRARRWSIFFKFLLALYLLALLVLSVQQNWDDLSAVAGKHTALVDLSGPISDATEASADTVIAGLRDAFKDENTRGVILRANSPGGSPVQSAYIYSEIRRLREKYPDTKLYAVITDLCASGCYYAVSAADEIYVDESSIIGSIGVRMDSFGFVDAMQKLGVERRLYTAGENKGFLDPFTPSRDTDVEHVNSLLHAIHEKFKQDVITGRGERLKTDAPELFSGLVWTGEQGVAMGLADHIGSAGYVAREVIGAEDIVDYTQEPDLLERLSERIGVAMARALGDVVASGSAQIR